jgi:hypothetical protein
VRFRRMRPQRRTQMPNGARSGRAATPRSVTSQGFLAGLGVPREAMAPTGPTVIVASSICVEQGEEG